MRVPLMLPPSLPAPEPLPALRAPEARPVLVHEQVLPEVGRPGEQFNTVPKTIPKIVPKIVPNTSLYEVTIF